MCTKLTYHRSIPGKPVQKNKLSHQISLWGFIQFDSEYYHVPYPSLIFLFLFLPPEMFLGIVMITNHQLPLQLHRNTFRPKLSFVGFPACLKGWPIFVFFFSTINKKVTRTNLQIYIFGNRPSVRLAISIYSLYFMNSKAKQLAMRCRYHRKEEKNLEESAIQEACFSLLFEKTTTTIIEKKNHLRPWGEPLSRSFFEFNFNFPTGSMHLMMVNAQIKPFWTGMQSDPPL